MRRSCRAVLVCGILSFTSRALASAPNLALGLERLRAADFAGALAAFDDSERADALTRDELLVLLAHRALAAQASGRSEVVETALRALASLDPEHRFDENFPPEITELSARLTREQPSLLRIRAVAAAEATGCTVTTRLEDDVAGIVREVRVHYRPKGSAHWTSTAGPVALIGGVGLDQVEYFVEAVGPGGAVVAFAGRADRPLRCEPVSPPRADNAWVWWAGAGVALAASVAAVFLLVPQQPDRAVLHGPTLAP